MAKIVTVGEILVRLAAPTGQSLEATPELHVYVAGAESNVAVGLARLRCHAVCMSVVPDNPLGRLIIGDLNRHGVDTSGISVVENGRVGLYFVEPGVPPRPPLVFYDRADSSFARARPDNLRWDVLDGAAVMHVTGITFATNPQVAQRALAEAQERGVAISFDLNYRRKLWGPEEARSALVPLLPKVRVLETTRVDAELVLKVTGSAPEVALELQRRYGSEVVVVTDGRSGAVAVFGGTVFQEPGYEIEVIDRIGAGDAFVAGFLSGWLDDGVERGLKAGTALAAVKHTYCGDVPWVTRAELDSLLSSHHEPWR